MPAYTLSTNPKFRGGKLYPKSAGVRVRSLTPAGQPDMSSAGVVRTASRPATLGTATGRQLVPATGPGWMEVTDAAGKTGWVRYDLLGAVPVTSIKDGDGKALVQAYVRNEVALGKVLARNRVLLDMRSKAISGGDSMLTEQKRLELRQKDRQRRILAAKDIIKVTGTIDPFHLVFKPAAIKRWYGINGIGVIPLVAWAIAAGVVLVAGVTWALVYSHFKTDAKASEIDLSKAEGLSVLLAKTDPATAKKVQDEVNAYGKNQYDTGAAAAVTEKDKKDGPLGEAGSLAKWGTIAFFAFKILA